MRSRELWTLEVHDMLEANVASLRLFVPWWLKNKGKRGQKLLTIDDLCEMGNSFPKALNGKGQAD